VELQILRISLFKAHLIFAFFISADSSGFVVLADASFVSFAVEFLSFKVGFCVFVIPVSG
jgi:hypothetical protein